MRKKKIHQALQGLDIYQLNAFKKFIISPYFNQNEKITEYFLLLERTLRNEESLDLLKDEEVWKNLTKEKYENVKFRKLSSDLYRLFEKFLSQKALENDDNYQLLLQSRYAKNINSEVVHSDINRKIELNLKKTNAVSSNKILESFLLKKDLYGLKIEYEKKHKSYKGDIVTSLKDLEYDLDKFYLIEKLRIYSTLLSWSRLSKIELNYNKFERFISRIATDLFKNVPAIKIYNIIYQLQTKDEARESFLELKELIKQHKYDFELEELKNIYEAAISYCIHKLNQGDESMNRQIFDLYQEALKDDVFLKNDELSPTTFRNVVAVALRLKEFEWTESFIHKFSLKLNIKYQENALNFNLARLHFYQGNFWDSISNLQLVSYDDVWYNLNSRTLLLACYYELDEQEVLDSQLSSFQVFIRRERSLGNRKNNYLNLIKFLKKLVKVPTNKNSKLLQLKDQVIETKGVVNKQWLLEKVDEKLNGK